MENTLLNLIPSSYIPEVHLSQYDIGRELTFKLMDGNSEYSVPSGATVEVKATKPSGLGFVVAGTFTDNVVTITNTETMSNEAGRFRAELSITSGSTLLGTSNFIFNIERSPHPEGTVDGDAETLLPELTLLVERIEASAQTVDEKAELFLNLSANATTLPSGSPATASYSNGVLSLGIPKGADGEVTEEALAETLEDYAKINGYYDEMTVGSAEQLLSTQFVSDSVPYKFRTSGGSSDIGNREYDEIVGGSIVWNQLVSSGATSVTVQSGHKYCSNINGTKTVASSNGTAISINDSSKDNIFDLTQMLGSTVADYIYSLEQAQSGKGVAFFKAMFPNDYYPYNAGELMSVEGLTSHDMVGLNAFDLSTGKAKVLGGYQYEVVGTYSSLSLDGTAITPTNRLFTPSKNGELTVTGGNDTTCIHLVWSGTRNGEYEPYKKHSYPLDSTLTLRGIPKVVDGKFCYDGDVYKYDGTVERRYRVVDLGTLNWVSNSTYNVFYTSLGVTPEPSDVNKGAYAMVPNYPYTTNFITDSTKDKCCEIGRSGYFANMLIVRDTSYSDVATFKTAMSGVYAVYKLATPTEETATPYDEIQLCDDFGTEEYVSSTIVPVGHNTKYPANLRDKLQHLPDLPSGDGYYLIGVSGTEMTLEVFRIPKAPTTNGTYTLKATVSGGTPTYTWEAE